MNAPGRYRPSSERWGRFASLAPKGAAWIIDARVARLHPQVLRAIRAPVHLELVRASEALKSTAALERLVPKLLAIPRGGMLVAVGGGTVGDFATVTAHLLKRGVDLVHVPTTLLAAVDSSVGGKGALNVGSVKNALGVFHFPVQTLLCPEFFDTLTAAQRREGLAEALKMAVCLDARVWAKWSRRAPGTIELVKTSRRLKERICAADPYELTGVRAVLNFGHTFGHVIESLSGFRVRHGEAVALGMLCALDVGRMTKVTPGKLADEVEAVLARAGATRQRLEAVFGNHPANQIDRLLSADKKSIGSRLRMVLLVRPGLARLVAT